MLSHQIKPLFEEWAHPDEQRSLQLTEYRTVIGRDGEPVDLKPGDLCTPLEARQYGLRTEPKRA